MEKASRFFLSDHLEHTASQADLRGTTAVFGSLSSRTSPIPRFGGAGPWAGASIGSGL